MCTESVCVTLSGDDRNNYSLSLRPIVSINLKESNCKMETTMNEDGKVAECELSWS